MNDGFEHYYLLLSRTQAKMPPQFGTFKQAQRVEQSANALQQESG